MNMLEELRHTNETRHRTREPTEMGKQELGSSEFKRSLVLPISLSYNPIISRWFNLAAVCKVQMIMTSLSSPCPDQDHNNWRSSEG